jgi:integrase
MSTTKRDPKTGTWYISYRTPEHPAGTKKRGFATKRDAELWYAATVHVALAKGDYIDPKHGRTTVGVLGEQWLARQRGHLKPSTIASWENVWKKRVKPRWGNVAIGDIRPSAIQSWIAEISAAMAPRTVRLNHFVLYGILKDACADGILRQNPAQGIKLPKPAPKRPLFLTPEQVQRLAEEADNSKFGKHGSMVLVMAVGGLRWGEATALRVADVDFLRRRIRVHQSAVFVKGKFHVQPPKTNSERDVTLPQFVIDALSVTAGGKDRDDLLWPSLRQRIRPGGQYQHRPSANNWFDRAVKRCQATDPDFPRITPHGLRHTAASIAVHAGANVKAVQRMLGHTKPSMTLDVYTDLFPEDLETVAESVAKMWPKPAATPAEDGPDQRIRPLNVC